MNEHKPTREKRAPGSADSRLRVWSRADWLLILLAALLTGTACRAGPADLALVTGGRAQTSIVVAADAGPWEARAASDLAKYIAMMSGAVLPIVHAAPATDRTAILVGKAALAAAPELAAKLAATVKKRPLVQGDAIVVRRIGNRLLVAGSNDESHYFAAAWLLQRWGCRWYMPTDFGEVVPVRKRLGVGALDFSYAPPFELRRYELAWNGNVTGEDEFQHRNFMSSARIVNAEALNTYIGDLAPKGGDIFQVPLSDPATAAHVADKVAADYAQGRDISLSISDGLYHSPADAKLVSEYDKAFLHPSMTDAMLTLYNNVAGILARRYPESRSRIGALAYVNVTLPPRIVTRVPPNLFIWLAPIDVDPNHAMDDPRSPQKAAYRDVVSRWAKLMDGRLGIYDYDQGMLAWRDLPDPSQSVFARDVKEYRRLGVLGFETESRGATATTFLNLFFRGQLMWDPDSDVRAMLDRFYPDFYGPAAAPMRAYWERIFAAWDDSLVTEHEYFAIPAIYTPALVAALRADLERGEAIIGRMPKSSDRDSDAYRERMHFTRLSFEVLADYARMTHDAASDADYTDAQRAGAAALEARLALTRINPTFTTRVIGLAAETAETGPSSFAGEVAEMRALAALSDGTKGTLVRRLPLSWDLRIDRPLPANWLYLGPRGPAGAAPDPPGANGGWMQARTDLYLQAQGFSPPVGETGLGDYEYRTTITLSAAEAAGPLHLLFPGLFNECWLFVNGKQIATRAYREPWWSTDYRFEWDVDLGGALRPGTNQIVLKGYNPHHMGGMFRRPFLYRAR